MKTISKKEFDILEKHILTDISFKEGGTFIYDNNTTDNPFDEKEAEQVKNTLAKIKVLITLLNKMK